MTWIPESRLERAIFAAPFVGAVIVVASRVSARAFRFLVAEDRVLEWAQVVFFLVAAIFAGRVAVWASRNGMRLLAAAYAAYAAVCVFIAGEEISWGQRLLGIETPEALERVNKQGEVTVHNVEGVLVFFNVGMMLLGLYGAVAPYVAQKWVLPVWTKWIVPPVVLAPAFLVTFVYKALRYTVATGSRYTVVKVGEWPEACIAFALAAFAFTIWRRRETLREGTRSPTGG